MTESHGTQPEEMLDEPSALAFARTTGFVLQGAGMALIVAGVCFWILSGFLVAPASQPPQRWTEHLVGDRLPSGLATIGIVLSIVGGLAVAVVGVGLHQDRPRSGSWATALTGLLCISYAAVGITLIAACSAWVTGVIAILLAVCCGMLFMLAGQSASLQRLHPPPQHNVITDEELEAIRSRSRH